MSDNTRLSHEVAAILKERGIDATPSDVIAWAKHMVNQYWEMRGKHTEVRLWLAGAVHNMTTPTMCLHLHFGDAKEPTND